MRNGSVKHALRRRRRKRTDRTRLGGNVHACWCIDRGCDLEGDTMKQPSMFWPAFWGCIFGSLIGCSIAVAFISAIRWVSHG